MNKKVAILDFDFHQGDGSQDIIKKLNLDIVHITGKTDYTRTDSKDFFNQLPALLERLKNVDIILYQAGADQESVVDGKRSIQKVLDIHNITMQECIAVFA